MHSDYGVIIMFIGFFVLLIAFYVAFIRWILRINHMISYLEKINEKLGRIEQAKTGI